jgi:hypothetical protein
MLSLVFFGNVLTGLIFMDNNISNAKEYVNLCHGIFIFLLPANLSDE